MPTESCQLYWSKDARNHGAHPELQQSPAPSSTAPTAQQPPAASVRPLRQQMPRASTAALGQVGATCHAQTVSCHAQTVICSSA